MVVLMMISSTIGATILVTSIRGKVTWSLLWRIAVLALTALIMAVLTVIGK